MGAVGCRAHEEGSADPRHRAVAGTMTEPSAPATHLGILLAMTFNTGIVDATSFLAMGHVFTANMTGNIVLLGFALGGAVGLSAPRSLLAFGAFLLGALVGGRWTLHGTAKGWIVPAIVWRRRGFLAWRLRCPP